MRLRSYQYINVREYTYCDLESHALCHMQYREVEVGYTVPFRGVMCHAVSSKRYMVPFRRVLSVLKVERSCTAALRGTGSRTPKIIFPFPLLPPPFSPIIDESMCPHLPFFTRIWRNPVFIYPRYSLIVRKSFHYSSNIVL